MMFCGNVSNSAIFYIKHKTKDAFKALMVVFMDWMWIFMLVRGCIRDFLRGLLTLINLCIGMVGCPCPNYLPRTQPVSLLAGIHPNDYMIHSIIQYSVTYLWPLKPDSGTSRAAWWVLLMTVIVSPRHYTVESTVGEPRLSRQNTHATELLSDILKAKTQFKNAPPFQSVLHRRFFFGCLFSRAESTNNIYLIQCISYY